MSTRVHSVSEQLRDGIMHSQYAGGSHMNEVDLAKEFGVSRTPIRAALSSLAAEGLLNYTPNAGYAVRSYSANDMLGVFEARAALEGLAARQAAENGLSDAQSESMSAMIAAGKALLTTDFWREPGAPRWVKLNTQFHAPIVEASRNDHLGWLLQQSRHIPSVHTTLYRAYDTVDVNLVARANEEHTYILESLINRQAARAEALLREHVYRFGEFVVARMRRQEAETIQPVAARRERKQRAVSNGGLALMPLDTGVN